MRMGQYQEEFLAGTLGALGLGIFAGSSVDFSLPLWGGGTAILLAFCAMLLHRRSEWSWMAFLLLFFFVGAFRFSYVYQLPQNDISAWEGSQVKVTGTVIEAPRCVETAEGRLKLRYVLSAESVMEKGEWKKATGGLYIYASAKTAKEVQEVRIGDALTAAGTVHIPHGYANPGQLDTNMLLRCKGITAQIMAGKQGVHVEKKQSMLFLRSMEEIRTYYRERMEKVMPKEDAAAIFAMLFGGYEGIKPELAEAFTVTGIVHILSVSGSHIGLLAATIAWLGGLFRVSKRLQVIFVLGAIVIYSVLSGCVPPVLRSAIMGGLTFLALALGREKEAGRILLLTGIFLLLVSPLYFFHISFQLSFLSTAGLLYLAPVLRRWMKERNLSEFIAGACSITIAAQAATLPILAWYFNQLSLSSLLSNLLIVPIVEGMIVIGLFTGILAFFLPFLGKLLFLFDSILLGVVYEMSRWMAKLPGSQVYFPTMPFGLSALFYVGMLFVIQRKERRDWLRSYLWQKRYLAGSILLTCSIFLLAWRLSKPQEIVFTAIDVGQGDAMLLVSPHGHAVMFDTGGTRDGAFDVGAKVDAPYLLHQGVRSLDYIFLTHVHEDHAAGVGGILRRLPVGWIVTASESREEYQRVMHLSPKEMSRTRVTQAEEGDCFTIDGVKIEVVYAPVATGKAATGNEVSNVYRISFGRASFLVTGDLVREEEKKLLAKGKDVSATVLKCGHHGSKTSSSEEFLQAVQPKWAIISAGRDNSFGHPHKEVVERLERDGIEICRTDRDGAIEFHTDGKKLWVKKYREGK